VGKCLGEQRDRPGDLRGGKGGPAPQAHRGVLAWRPNLLADRGKEVRGARAGLVAEGGQRVAAVHR
nr:hypothetical protein [Tanacetum cinerariifolium]